MKYLLSILALLYIFVFSVVCSHSEETFRPAPEGKGTYAEIADVVPYTGATTDVDLGAKQLDLGRIDILREINDGETIGTQWGIVLDARYEDDTSDVASDSLYGVRIWARQNAAQDLTHLIGMKIEGLPTIGGAGDVTQFFNLYLADPSTQSTGTSSAIHIEGLENSGITFAGSAGSSSDTASRISSPGYGYIKIDSTRLVLPVTESSSATNLSRGVLFKDGSRFMHDFKDTGGAAEPDGNNVYLGLNAGNIVTNGNAGVTETYEGSSNTGVGAASLYAITNGFGNTCVGATSGIGLTTGSLNSIVGYQAMDGITVSSGNSALGRRAGRYVNAGTSLTSATDSIFIGDDARANAVAETNQIVIGTDGRGHGSNTTTIGNASTIGTYLPDLAGTYTGGSAHVCVSDAGLLFFSEAACP